MTIKVLNEAIKARKTLKDIESLFKTVQKALKQVELCVETPNVKLFHGILKDEMKKLHGMLTTVMRVLEELETDIRGNNILFQIICTVFVKPRLSNLSTVVKSNLFFVNAYLTNVYLKENGGG